MSSKFTRVLLVVTIVFGLPGVVVAEKNLTPLQKLGKEIFFDTNLSSPPGQACGSCHDPQKAFTDPFVDTPVSLGAVVGRIGARNTPSAAYAAFSPYFHFDEEEGLFVGGQFLDGRSTNLQE